MFTLEPLETRQLLAADAVPREDLPRPSDPDAGSAEVFPVTGGWTGGEVGSAGALADPWAGLDPEPVEGTSGPSARLGLHAVAGIPDLVNPAEALPLLLAPGRVRLDLTAAAAGRAGLWTFVLPDAGGAGNTAEVEFGLRGIVGVPTDGALAWYDESGNRLGVADAGGAVTLLTEDSGRITLEKGRRYLVGVFVNRALPADAARLELAARGAVTGATVGMDARTGVAGVSFLDLGEVFQSPSDVRWHPLGLLNAGAEAKVKLLPEIAGRDVTMAVYRKVPAAQQLAGGDGIPVYTLVGASSSVGTTGAEVTLRAPSGATLSEQEYVVAVAPKGYATGASGYRVEIQATAPLVAPAALSAAEVAVNQAFGLRPTETRGVAEAEFRNQTVTGDAARYFSFRAAANGPGLIRVEAGFDAVVGLYSANRGLLALATDVVAGAVELRSTFESGDLYYVRVVNGPVTSPREGTGFQIDLRLPTAPGSLTLAAPAGGSGAVDDGGFTIGTSANAAPTFFELQPAMGIDVITFRVQAPSNGAIRISVASVDGFRERIFAVGQLATLSVPVRTQGAPLQVAVASTGSFGSLFYYNGLTLPRELAPGTLAGRTPSPAGGQAELTASGFDRSGDRAGFEFYQGIVPAGRTGVWTAQGSGGALPVLARYVAAGSVLQLVGFELADAAGEARMEFTVAAERLYAAVAFQVARQDGGAVRVAVDHPAPIPVGVGMVPDLEYEAQNQNPARFGYILQIRSMVLQQAYEQDYWETLLPDRFFNGNVVEDAAMPVLEVRPDTPGSALRLQVTVLDGDGDPLRRWNGVEIQPFQSGADGVIRVDFATLGVFRQSLEGRKLQFRVTTAGGALGDGTYTLRMTVRTPDAKPYEITEARWAYPGGGTIPAAVGAVSTFPAGTRVVDVPQNAEGEGSVSGSFASSAVDVDVYRFWTPSGGSFRVWTTGEGADPANTTIRLYRARYAVTADGERTSWWETVDYLEALDGVEASRDWHPADRSEIDAQVVIEDPEFPAYKKPTNVLGQSVVGNPPESQLATPYLPADRQFSDVQDVYFVVVKNEQGSTGGYRLSVSTGDLPRLRQEAVYLAQRPNAANLRSVISVDVPGVEAYGNRVGYYEVQMPEQHSGYLGISGQSGANWRVRLYGADGREFTTSVDVDGERRYVVTPGGRVVRVVVVETGRNDEANDRITFAVTLLEDAGLPTNFSSLGLDSVAHTLLPTTPWGELDAGDFTGSAPVDSAGRVYRFRAPEGPVRVEVAPIAGSQVSFLWGLYEDGRLVAWDLAVPGQPGTQATTLAISRAEIDTLAGAGRNLMLVVRHASGSVQPAQFGIVIEPQRDMGFGTFDPARTSVTLPPIATESRAVLGLQGATTILTGGFNQIDWAPDQWVRFLVPDTGAPGATLVDLPTGQNVYPLRYDVYDASGRTRIASGTETFADSPNGIALPQLEGGKAYLLRLAPRDQPLGASLPVRVEFQMPKTARVNGAYVHAVPDRSPHRPSDADYAFVNFRGDFSTTVSLNGRETARWYVDVDRAGPATLKAVVSGSTRVSIAIYRDDGTGEFPTVSLVDFVNESSVVTTADGKEFELETFLGAGGYFIEVARSNTNGGSVRLDFTGPERPVESLTVDPNQGVVLRSQMGRAGSTQFFEVVAPAGSYGTGIFLAYDLDLLDGRPQIQGFDNSQTPPLPIISELTLRARMQVWAVSDGFGPGGEVAMVLAKTLDREPTVNRTEPLKATLETTGKATPFQRYIIGIFVTGVGPGFQDEVSGRSKSIGVQALFAVPNSGTPDLEVESMRLLPNSGKTLVEVTIVNRGYAVALNSQSRFLYPGFEAGQPVTATLAETVLGPQGRRVRQLDWVNPTSPQDVTGYTLDVEGEIAEIDEGNNAGQAAMNSVNAARPVFSLSLANGLDGNSDPGVWGRYLDSRGHNDAKVLTDILLDASDADDAANTYDTGPEIYLLRSDSPLPYTSGNHFLEPSRVIERVAISNLAPTGPGTPNIFSAYAVDRFGLRSETEIRVIQIVPFPKWMDAGETEVVFDRDAHKYQLEFRARPVDYAATLSGMLDANVPLVGDLQNRFYVEAVAEREFSLDPGASISPIQPSIRARTTVFGQDILDEVFGPGTIQDHVSVLGHIDVRPDTLEAGAFELSTRFDQYPVDRWEGPEIPIFGFDAGIVSAAVQAQVIVDLKFDAAVTFAFDLTQTDAPLRITSPSYVGLDLRIDLRFEGEVEVAGFLDIASVGGGFFFTLKPRYGLEDMTGSIPLENFLSEACLGLSATLGGELSADILGFEVFSLELESDEIQLTNCDVATASMQALPGLSGLTSLTGTTGGYPLGEGRLGLQSAMQALPNDNRIRLTQTILAGDALLSMPAIRPNPQLVLEAATGERMLAYLEAPTAGAPPVLYVARGNADGFAAPVALTSGEWMSRPLLVSTRDGNGFRAVVVYQTTPNPTDTTTRNQFLGGQDLRYRYFDGTAWTEELVLTDNAQLDWQASMAFNANGDGALAWVQKNVDAPLDAKGNLTGTDRLLVARWDKTAHRWLAPSPVGSNGTHNQPSVAIGLDGVIGVAWNQRVGADHRLGLARRATNGTWTVGSVVDTTLPATGRPRTAALVIDPDGRFTVVTAFTEAMAKNQPVVTRVLARTGTFDELRQQAKAFEVLARTGGVSSLQLVRSPEGTLAVGWHERRGGFSDVVVVRRQDDGTWTRPARVTQSAGNERAVRLVVDGAGAVLSVFERGVHFFAGPGGALLPADGPDLKLPATASGLLGSGFALRGAELNIVGPLHLDGLPADQRPDGLAGATVEASVVIRNTGGATADALVTFYRISPLGLGGRDVKLEERKVRLLPGGSVVVGVPVALEAGVNRFSAEVTLASGRDAFTTRDNTVSGQMTGLIDLAVDTLSIAEQVAGISPQVGAQIGMRYEIVNRSGVAYRGPVRVTTFWEDPAKPGVRTTVQTGAAELEFAPGQRRALAGLFAFDQPGLRLVGVEISEIKGEELSTANNRASIPLDLRPNLALRDVEVIIRGEPARVVPAISVQVINDSGVGNAVVRVAVSNTGSAPVTSFTLRLTHAIEGGPFAEVFAQSFNGLLAPGEFRLVELKAPALAGLNVYRAEVTAAAADLPFRLPEPVLADNVAQTAVVVQGLPDLQVGSTNFVTPAATPTVLRVGATARLDVRVDNQGIAVARNVLVEVFALSRGLAGEGVLIGSVTLDSVAALGSATVRITLDTTVLPESTDSVRVVVDRHQKILERTDLNNTASRSVAVAPPSFVAGRGLLNAGTGQLSQVNSLGVVFNQDLALPRDASVLRLENVATGEIVDPATYTLSLDAATRTVTWKFTGLPGGVLPPGEYVARIDAGAISDRRSNALGRDFVMRFVVTPGDANGDGITNERDYLLVWRELRKAEPARSLNLDVDGDGKVTTTDLDLVRRNFGRRGVGGGAQP